MTTPETLSYAKTHEWVRREENGELTVGITDHAQNLLGDLVFAELPEVGNHITAAEPCMLLESVKAASDIYMPLSGEIIAVNQVLEDTPELVNEDAFGDGWLFKIRPDNINDIDLLMSASAYETWLDE